MTLLTFAQAATDTVSGPWAAASAFVVLIMTQVSKMMSDARKDRRDLANDAIKQAQLERIANSNEEAVIAQTQVKSALEASHAMDKERHETLLAAVNRIPCKQYMQQPNP